MRYDRTTDALTFARHLVALARDVQGGVTVQERVCAGSWMLCATARLSPSRVLLLEATVGRRLDALPADAWPTHSQALIRVREDLTIVEAAAAHAKLACSVELLVSVEVLAERPCDAPTPTPVGRRLGAALAWSKRRAA